MDTSPSSKVLGIIQLVFVVAVVFFALFLTRMMKPKEELARSQNVSFVDSVLSVTVTHPQSLDFTPKLSLTGSVSAQTETQITPQVNGQVVWVNKSFTPGATVNKGEVLFRIESEDFELAVDQAEANITASLSNLKVLEAEAKVAKSEWKDLYPNKDIPELAARIPQMQAARSQLAAAEASKKTAELALRRTRIIAPAKARILDTSLDVGQLVSPLVAVGTLYALDNVEIAVPISSDELQLLTPAKGRQATLILENQNGHILGVVSRLGSVLDPRTRQATLYIQPENVSGLTIGSFVNAHISASTVNGALEIPVSSLYGRNQVWVVEDDALESRLVTVLEQNNGSLIVAPFDMGQGVLIFPPAEAYDGQNVHIRSEDK